MISTIEKDYIIKGIQSNIRNDGRTRFDHRGFLIEIDTLPQASGSSRVVLDSTDVIVGVRLDIGQPLAKSPTRGYVQCSADSAPSVIPDYDLHGDVSKLCLNLSEWITNILMTEGALPLDELCIQPYQHCWVISIDILILGFSGNLYDAAMLAVRGALFSCKVPGISLSDPGEIEISEDLNTHKPLDVSNVPVSVTFSKIGSSYVLDSSLQEELVTESRLVIAINSSNNILSIHKSSALGLSPAVLLDMIQNAQQIAVKLIKSFDNRLAQTLGQPPQKSAFLL